MLYFCYFGYHFPIKKYLKIDPKNKPKIKIHSHITPKALIVEPIVGPMFDEFPLQVVPKIAQGNFLFFYLLIVFWVYL